MWLELPNLLYCFHGQWGGGVAKFDLSSYEKKNVSVGISGYFFFVFEFAKFITQNLSSTERENEKNETVVFAIFNEYCSTLGVDQPNG